MQTTDCHDEARQLVGRLAERQWYAPLTQLARLGRGALPAVREGLRHGDWRVRRACAVFLDHHADPESLPDLIPLLHDPKSLVRMWAVHSLGCDRCKQDDCPPIDVLPHLIERFEQDESIRVRRAVVMVLAWVRPPEAASARLFQAVLERETDYKIRLHARAGLEHCREAGL